MEVIGQCPICKSNVYDTGMAYICEKATGPKKTCTFRSGKVILQRQMTKEETAKLIREGKTDLLHKFISKKGRPFSAYLVLGKDGKVNFEFEPRKAKAPARSQRKRWTRRGETGRECHCGASAGRAEVKRVKIRRALVLLSLAALLSSCISPHSVRYSFHDYRLDHDSPVDAELQRELEQIDSELRQRFEMTPAQSAVGLLDLRTLRLAMIHPDRGEYAASIPKIGILLAWFDKQPEGSALHPGSAAGTRSDDQSIEQRNGCEIFARPRP